MSNEEIAKLEREISESIEPAPGDPAEKILSCGDPSQDNGWMCDMVISKNTGMHVLDYVPRPWTSDETANAMLLEMMPAPRLEFLPDAQTWLCHSNWLAPDLYADQSAPQMEHADRKLAVCLTFKAWREKQCSVN